MMNKRREQERERGKEREHEREREKERDSNREREREIAKPSGRSYLNLPLILKITKEEFNGYKVRNKSICRRLYNSF